MQNNTEVEVKIPLSDRAGTESRLKELGFRQSIARRWESNDLYDTEDQLLRQSGMILRLRQAGDESILTWKGSGAAGPYKTRPELETSIGSLATFRQILEQLGYVRAFRYEKYRTEYIDGSDGGTVMVDETPIGDFLEIEGRGDWIDATATRLGFSPADYVLESYGRLYLEHCRKRGLEPGDMVFASHPAEVGATG
jgi:adenylate cyclase, class 2